MYNEIISHNNSVRRKFSDTVRDKIGDSMDDELFNELDIYLKKLEDTYEFEQKREDEIKRITAELRAII